MSTTQVDLPGTLGIADIGPTRALARGATGSVEEILGDRLGVGYPLVVKRFHNRVAVDYEALLALIQWRRALNLSDRARLDRCAAWPVALLQDGPRPVGHVMRRLPRELEQAVRLPSGRCRIVLREAQYAFVRSERARRLGLSDATDDVRLEYIAALADTIDFLHERRIVVGDLSSRNVICGEAGDVFLVDCDSFTLGGVGSPLPPVFTVDWDDPAQPGLPAASSDVYKLGLFALRILSRSFQTRDPRLAADMLDGTGKVLLSRSLSTDSTSRPTAESWAMWAAARRAARGIHRQTRRE